jgi:glucose/arabinose dehydrogenase
MSRQTAPWFSLLLAASAGADPPAEPPREVSVVEVAHGFDQPTDLQFWPGSPDVAIVLGKSGTAWWVKIGGEQGKFFDVDVVTRVEEGLLGLAFHPKFAENRRFFTNRVASVDGRDATLIDEWSATSATDPAAGAKRVKTLLTQPQPYANHNAGQLQFGPDGKLYLGFGDGGAAGDPHGNGQNPGTWLGKMLRLDVDGPALAPPDNPFVGKQGYLPEIWATGLRNPWRYSFAPDGRLVVGDVGQDRWEEVDIVERGGDYGWDVREAAHCHEPKEGCVAAGHTDPVWEYPHGADGVCVTGGYSYTGSQVPTLKDTWVFGDFASGRLWALPLPPGGAPGKVRLLGHFDVHPSTFGRDAAGELYFADVQSGKVFRLAR